MKKGIRIILEPGLELQTATFSSGQCRALARVYMRWTRQLLVKAVILELHVEQPPSPPKLRLKLRGQRWN